MSDAVIIWNEGKGDVLSRFARALSNGTNWPIVRKPDPKAQINYFMLYVQVAQSPQGLKGLNKTAALFSHYETEVPKKADWWDKAIGLVDIRTTWAQQYLEMLLPYGDSFLVTPPIDPQFKRQKKPRIGVSGYVHPGGRKGEGLLKRLVAEHSNDYEIIASGVGWPVLGQNIRERKWEEMPAFYESLDIYLVTSLTEGIPMPPLEALAMGVPVIVPRGVGLMDTIIGRSGVYDYAVGDYASMLRNIEWAIGDKQSAISEFTEDAWCESHRIAFGFSAGAEIIMKKERTFIDSLPEKWDKQTPKKGRIAPIIAAQEESPIELPKIPYIPASGAILVAYGEPARDCAKLALSSWRKYMPKYPIALVSDSPIGEETLFIEHPDTDIGARSVKTKLDSLAPAEWENILYLDADTEMVADVSVLFQWLADGFDFLICINPVLYSSLRLGQRPDNAEELDATIDEIGSEETAQPNGGVFAWRRGERSKALMQGWSDEWQRWGGRDQMALLRTLHKNPVKWILLGQEFNTVTRFTDPSITAGILHHALRARRWTGIVYGRLDSEAAWKKVKEKQ